MNGTLCSLEGSRSEGLRADEKMTLRLLAQGAISSKEMALR